MSIKVCIDAGHGGKDPGAVLGKRYEKDDALKIAKRLGKVLKANGIEVCHTRTTDIYDSPSTKAKKANSTKADYLISIHRNAAASSIAHGTEVLICNTNNKKYDIAKAICKQFKERNGFMDRGVKMRNDLALLNKTIMPAILVEVGFISCKQDNELLDEKFASVVNAIACGFMNGIGLQFKTLTQLGK